MFSHVQVTLFQVVLIPAWVYIVAHIILVFFFPPHFSQNQTSRMFQGHSSMPVSLTRNGENEQWDSGPWYSACHYPSTSQHGTYHYSHSPNWSQSYSNRKVLLTPFMFLLLHTFSQTHNRTEELILTGIKAASVNADIVINTWVKWQISVELSR